MQEIETGLMLKHASGIYKNLPGFPDVNDVSFLLFSNKKKLLSVDDIVKLTNVEPYKLTDPLAILMEQGIVTRNEKDQYSLVDKTKIIYPDVKHDE